MSTSPSPIAALSEEALRAIEEQERAIAPSLARDDVLALVAEVRRQREEIANLRRSCEVRGVALEKAEKLAAAERALRLAERKSHETLIRFGYRSPQDLSAAHDEADARTALLAVGGAP